VPNFVPHFNQLLSQTVSHSGKPNHHDFVTDPKRLLAHQWAMFYHDWVNSREVVPECGLRTSVNGSRQMS
jgi:hypothetical protein